MDELAIWTLSLDGTIDSVAKYYDARYSDACGNHVSNYLDETGLGVMKSAIGDMIVTGDPVFRCVRTNDGKAHSMTLSISKSPHPVILGISRPIPCLPTEMSPRELEVMALLRAGLKPGDIQKALLITTSTYHEHLRRAKMKTRSSTSEELAIVADRMALRQ